MKSVYYENNSYPFLVSIDDFLTPNPHLHKELELIYVFNGSTTAFVDRKNYNLKSGDLFLSFPNQIHYYKNTVVGEYMLIVIKPEILFGLTSILYDTIPTSNVLSFKNNDDVVQILQKINSANGEFKFTKIAGFLILLFGIIIPKFNLKPRIKTNNSTLKDILKFCAQNFTTDITLEDISNTLHISKCHISRLFNEKLGINFNSYINMLRINKACDLLENTNKKITDISGEVGFGSIRSFNRAFSQTLNTSPLKYRNDYLKQSNNVVN